MTLTELADRDGWRCWVCGGAVDPGAPAGSGAAASADHVVPRARGGSRSPANLRQAHRGCNGRRGSRLPELDWPRELPVAAQAPLWPVVQRARRRPGEWEVVAFAATPDLAESARHWLAITLPGLLGGSWEVGLLPAAGQYGVRVRASAPAG